MAKTPVEEAWIDEVEKFFKEQEDDMDGATVSIFDVPKVLKSVKPEAYMPQLVAIGPYHHWREDLCTMERYKLVVAKKVQGIFGSITFEKLVKKLGEKDHKIRACYHTYLKMDGKVLSWMMAIDSLFLIEFLHTFVDKHGTILAKSTRMSFLVDSKGNKLGFDSVVKDIMMLENQIPLFVLRRILRIQKPDKELAKIMLPRLIQALCDRDIVPLPLVKSKNEKMEYESLKTRAHLLDILYHLLVPSCEESLSPSRQHSHTLYINGEEHQGCLPQKLDHSPFKKLYEKISGLVLFQKMKQGPLKLVGAIGTIAFNVASHLGMGSGEQGGEDEGSGDGDKAPRVEEIMIPSVSELVNVGVEFVKSDGGISTINFDSKTRKFYLPKVKVDVNSEVILRNLVAYEALAISDRPLVLARYTELMNGIVDTAEDAKILIDRRIIDSQLNFDQVADIWNGMSKSIRLTYVDFIDKTIKEVNKYYGSTRKVRFYRAMKAYVYGSWRILVLFATILVIGLMCLQSFCTVYDCPRVFHFETIEE